MVVYFVFPYKLFCCSYILLLLAFGLVSVIRHSLETL